MGAGLPLMSTFLNRMRDTLEALDGKPGHGAARKAISDVLDYRLDAASAAYWSTLDLENIEQLFSLAYAARHPVSKSLPTALAATLEHCRSLGRDRRVFVNPTDSDTSKRLRPPLGSADADWAKDTPRLYRLIEAAETEGATTSHVAALIGMVNQKSKPAGANTVITFNYDTIFEDALTRLEVPWTYGYSKRSMEGFFHSVRFVGDEKGAWGRALETDAIPVLKLHGSVNWAIKPKGGPTGPQLNIYPTYDGLRAAHEVPRLVPPTWSKTVEDHLSIPWQQAIERITTATHIIIIGFSMPETDLHFRYLLAAGLQRNASLRKIVFVNPDPEGVEKRARAVLRSSYIDQGLITFVKNTADGYASELLQGGHPMPPNTPVDIGRAPEWPLRFWTPQRR